MAISGPKKLASGGRANLNFSVKADVYRRLKAIADIDGRSMTEEVSHLVVQRCEELGVIDQKKIGTPDCHGSQTSRSSANSPARAEPPVGKERVAVLNAVLDMLGASPRLRRGLSAIGVSSVRELTQVEPSHLLRLPQIGVDTVDELRTIIELAEL